MYKNKKNQNNIFHDIRFVLILSIILLTIGVLGFYIFHKPDWYEAIYDASSILSAVGAANEPETNAAKIFASIYTLVVGLGYIFLISYTVTYLLKQQE
jgi:hypothetical protein